MNSPANNPVPAADKAASGSKPAAKAVPPSKSAPPPAKGGGKKRSWWRLKLTLFLLLVGAGAAVYYLPQQVEKLSGVKIPNFVPSAKKTAEKARTAAEAQVVAEEAAVVEREVTAVAEPVTAVTEEVTAPTVELAPVVVDEEVVDDEFAFALPREEELYIRVRQLRHAVQMAQQDIDALKRRLRESELQNSALAAQLAGLRQSGAGIGLQVQVIALQLHSSGDAAAAAAALNALAATAEEVGAAQWLLNEAARLEGVPTRAQLLQTLEAVLAPLPATEQEAAEDGVAGLVKTLFNVQRTPAGALGREARAALTQLQLHLLTRREGAYWQLLQAMRAETHHSEVVTNLLERLVAYGEPDYQLSWQE